MKFNRKTFCSRVILLFAFLFLKIAAASDTLYYKEELLRHNLLNIESKYSKKQAEKLIAYWDSVYPKDKVNLYNYLSHTRWEKILCYQYINAKNNKNNKIASKLAFALGVIYHRQTKFEDALPYLIFAVKEKNYIRKDQYQNALLRLELSYRSMGVYDKAITIRKKRIVEGFSNNFWELYSVVGMHYEALDDFKLFEKKPLENDFELILYYNKLGKLFLKNRQPDSAFVYFNKMEKKANFIIKSTDYLGKNEYTEFVKEYFKHLAISQQGECLLKKGAHKKAIPVLKDVIPFCNKIKEVDQKIFKWISIVKAYTFLGKNNAALKLLDSIKTSTKNKRILEVELDWLKQNALVNRNLGNVSVYNQNMQKYFWYKDSIDYSNQKNKSLLVLAKFDIQQKKELLLIEKAKTLNYQLEATNKKRIIIFITIAIVALLIILFLIYNNLTTQKKAKVKLEQSNNDLVISSLKIEAESKKNEFLLKEIHHRIKNNLQMISSLLSLQKNTIQNPDVKTILNDSKSRIKTMALVHQQLYEKDNFGNVSLEHYLTEIISNTIASYNASLNIDFSVTAPCFMGVDTSMNIGLIVNETLINSIKHNIDSKIHYEIELYLKDGIYNLIIKDNGKGFDLNNKSGFGLQLIKILTQQIGGELISESIQNKGAQHKITFSKTD